MPNTLISIFVSNPATEPVEAPHPNTGVYVTGTQATVGGPWTVTHTLVTKTTTPLTMVGRLKNYPTVTVAVVATGGPNAGNIFNNVPAAPLGTSASGTSTGISVTASTSPNGLANRIFACATSTGTFLQIYQGAASSYPHPLVAGTVQYYKYQYVGAGFYDDSPLSLAFMGTASTSGYQIAMLTDSRGAYPGDTGTVTTSSVWALAQARIQSGSTFTGAILHHGNPGATAAQMLDPAFVGGAQYTTIRTTSVSCVDYMISQRDTTKTLIVLISFGANPSANQTADIKAIHDAFKARLPGTITIGDPVLNRLDPSFSPNGLPNRATINAFIDAGVGVWSDDEVRSANVAQLYANDAPNNGTYFWNPDSISGLSYVHLTTAGNQLQSENYAQAYARRLGITLTPLPVPAEVSASLLQTDPLMRFSGGGWSNYSPNIQYISGYGGVSPSDTATFGFTANCYGWRIVSPTSNIAGAVQAIENGAQIATGTEYSVDAPASAAPAAVIMSKYYGTTSAVHSVDVSHNGSATGTYLFCNLMQFCDVNGVFPAIPVITATYVAYTLGTGTATQNTAAHSITYGGTTAWASIGLGTLLASGNSRLDMQSGIPVTGAAFIFGFTGSGATSANYTDIAYGFYLDATGQWGAIENGTFMYGPAASTAGQTNLGGNNAFAIVRTGTAISYLINGITKYTSLVASSAALLPKVSLNGAGATLNTLQLTAASTAPFTAPAAATPFSGPVAYTLGGAATQNAAAYSITAGNATAWGSTGLGTMLASGNCFVELATALPPTAGNGFIFGFTGSGAVAVNYTDIAYGFYLDAAGGWGAIENGTFKFGSAASTAGQVALTGTNTIRVARTGTAISYLINGITKYTSLVASSTVLRPKVALNGTGATVTSLQLTADSVAAG